DAIATFAAPAANRVAWALGPGAAVLGGLGAHAARVRPRGIRARRGPRRTLVLQRPEGDRPARARLRPLDRGASGRPPQGPDVPGRLGPARRGAGRGYPGARGGDPHGRRAEGHPDP